MAARVLVVDDDGGIRRMVKILLEDAGFAVDVAVSGNDALKRLRRIETPHVIILDLSMPGMSARDFMEQLKLEGYPNRVLVLTANHAGLEIGFLIGADDVMEKPFDPPELVERVRALAAATTAAE